MKPEIKEFIKSKRFAVVGVSRNERKFGNTIYKELKDLGYVAYGVNPSIETIHGEKCYPSISALRGQVDAAVVCVKPDKVEQVLRDATEAGVRQVWLQQGAGSRHAVDVAKSLGLNVVDGKCILLYADPVRSVHSFHRFFVKLLGRY